MSTTPEKMYKTKEVAERLNVSRDTVLSLVKKGALRAVWAGPRSPRISESSLIQFEKSGGVSE